MSTLEELRQVVIDGQADKSKALTQKAMDEGIGAETILNDALISAMSEVGQLFETGEYFVPEMLVSARAMKAGLELLRPALAAQNVQSIGKVVIGTVQGDLHDIGKNLVAMMLEGAGFEVYDLGVDVSPQKFVDAVKQHQPQFIGFSALLTTTMPKMKVNIEALKNEGLRNSVKVMVGGAPVTQKFATEIGADIYATDASSAASQARTAIGK
jgi:5-methyltetrahydrofolate--homocysteine methyltransferase